MEWASDYSLVVLASSTTLGAIAAHNQDPWHSGKRKESFGQTAPWSVNPGCIWFFYKKWNLRHILQKIKSMRWESDLGGLSSTIHLGVGWWSWCLPSRSADLSQAVTKNLESERSKLQAVRDKLQSSLDQFEDQSRALGVLAIFSALNWPTHVWSFGNML